MKFFIDNWQLFSIALASGGMLVWPILRGLYMAPGAPEREYKEWVDALGKAANQPATARALARAGMNPMWLTGRPLEQAVGRSGWPGCSVAMPGKARASRTGSRRGCIIRPMRRAGRR